MALSVEYFSVPGETGVDGSSGDTYVGSWWLVGPVASQAPCMSYVMTFA